MTVQNTLLPNRDSSVLFGCQAILTDSKGTFCLLKMDRMCLFGIFWVKTGRKEG